MHENSVVAENRRNIIRLTRTFANGLFPILLHNVNIASKIKAGSNCIMQINNC